MAGEQRARRNVRLADVGLFERRAGKGPPDIFDLRLSGDVGGLVGSLECDAPSVVREAADAIGQIRQGGAEPASSQAGQAGRELLVALAG